MGGVDGHGQRHGAVVHGLAGCGHDHGGAVRGPARRRASLKSPAARPFVGPALTLRYGREVGRLSNRAPPHRGHGSRTKPATALTPVCSPPRPRASRRRITASRSKSPVFHAIEASQRDTAPVLAVVDKRDTGGRRGGLHGPCWPDRRGRVEGWGTCPLAGRELASSRNVKRALSKSVPARLPANCHPKLRTCRRRLPRSGEPQLVSASCVRRARQSLVHDAGTACLFSVELGAVSVQQQPTGCAAAKLPTGP